MKAPCSAGYFLCNNNPLCVEQRYQCDGTSDCPDESDEQDCEDSHKLQYWNNLFRKRPDEDREKKATRKCFMVNHPDQCSCSSFSLFCEHRKLVQVPKSLPKETQDLVLSNNPINRLENGSFKDLISLVELDLRDCQLEELDTGVFDPLVSLKTLWLDGNALQEVAGHLFAKLANLETLYFDEFRLCSYALHVRLCEPRGDGISSFAHLLDNVVLRVSVWIVALLACFGNLFVIIGRMFMQETNEVHSFFIKNLALADLLMGVYLFIIAYYDVSFRGEYIKHEENWRHSWQCNLSGSLSTLSSEASVFILTVITIDRYLSVSYPFSLKKRTKTFAFACMFLVWSTAAILAVLPLMDTVTFGDEFYGNNGVCLALQIHEPYSIAWEYSAFLFCGLNMAAFLFVAYAYANMSLTIASSQMGLRSHQQQQDRNIAQRFAFIVATDCLCWMPIFLIKILALAGVPINDDLYAWVAVFFLPVNSALNPILYTLTTKLFKEHLVKIMGSHSNRRNGCSAGHGNGSPTIRDHSGTSLTTIINMYRGSCRSSKPLIISMTGDTSRSNSTGSTVEKMHALALDGHCRDGRDSFCLQRFLSTDTQHTDISDRQ
ncbi:Relaxin receptor 1 [Halotydeus destructor]|nr:Relaxin receptor 1 [Halotydeus destructor]